MKLAQLALEVFRTWLDIRFLRWSRDRQHPFRVFHGEKPRLPAYRKRR